jgi:hypothetical protein
LVMHSHYKSVLHRRPIIFHRVYIVASILENYISLQHHGKIWLGTCVELFVNDY